MEAFEYNHPGSSKIYIWDFAVIREIFMNKHRLQYIHFTEYSVCMWQEERWRSKSRVVTFPGLVPWPTDWEHICLHCRASNNFSRSGARWGLILHRLHRIQGYPSKHRGGEVTQMMMCFPWWCSVRGMRLIWEWCPLCFSVCRPVSEGASRHALPWGGLSSLSVPRNPWGAGGRQGPED